MRDNGDRRKVGRVLLFAVVAIIVLIWAVTCSRAGDVRVSWDESQGATGYKVYAGHESRVYTQVADVGNLQQATIQLPDGCEPWLIAVTAYNAAGESGYSPEAGPNCSRPIIGDPTTSDNPGILLIPGNNFCPGITLTVNGTPVESIVRDSCEMLSVPMADIPVGSTTQASVFRLCNGPVCADIVLTPAQPILTTPIID